jgi:spoIIIJ-associated protein
MDPNNVKEFTGDDVDSAIAAGLEELGVGPGDVLVEILEESSRGVFGIGAKPARVRLKLLRTPEPSTTQSPLTSMSDTPHSVTNPEHLDDDSVGEDGAVGKEVLTNLLNDMDIRGEITISRSESTRPGEESPWLLDISGGDMSLLIGRRGETLSALQYVTRLITSRKLQRRANIVIDAGSYKSRRSDRLEQLANRMADQAVEQQRKVTLEPMPPNERRIIHLTLRKRNDVETQSEGEGASRKVAIIPK